MREMRPPGNGDRPRHPMPGIPALRGIFIALFVMLFMCFNVGFLCFQRLTASDNMYYV